MIVRAPMDVHPLSVGELIVVTLLVLISSAWMLSVSSGNFSCEKSVEKTWRPVSGSITSKPSFVVNLIRALFTETTQNNQNIKTREIQKLTVFSRQIVWIANLTRLTRFVVLRHFDVHLQRTCSCSSFNQIAACKQPAKYFAFSKYLSTWSSDVAVFTVCLSEAEMSTASSGKL